MKKQFRFFPHAVYSNRLKLSLASYNCGAGHVFDARDVALFYKNSPEQWKYVKIYLTMLKSNNWQTHLQIWPQGKPKYGYFYGYRETISYVDNIWEMYEIYRQLF
jgi:membrane-bound lytic murein transglycosylase F